MKRVVKVPEWMKDAIVLWRRQGVSTKVIAGRLDVKYSTAAHYVAQLINDGLVERRMRKAVGALNIMVTEAQREWLYEEQHRHGVSASEIIRQLINEGMKTWTLGSSAADATSETSSSSTT